MSESIYNWIERKGEEVVKPPRYRSRHDPLLPPTGTTFVLPNSTKLPGANLGEESTAAIMRRNASQRAATMGYSKRDLHPDPHGFVRAGQRKPRATDLLREPPKPYRREEPPRRPAVPARDDKPTLGVRSNTNFVVKNAVDAILAEPPKKAAPRSQQMLACPDYARRPEYLDSVRHEIDEEKAMIEEMYMQRAPEEGHRGESMDESERIALLTALKAKWEETNRAYQRITHITKLDTIGKIQRKEAYETELAQLERDIELLSQKRSIVVVPE